MSTEYIVTPKEINSFVREETYKKGKLKFTVLSTWKTCKIIFTGAIPKAKTIKNVRVTRLKRRSFYFDENEFDYTSILVLPHKLAEDIKELINNSYEQREFTDLKNGGWILSKIVYKLLGDFNVVPIHEITLFSMMYQIDQRNITKAEFEEYSINGMPQRLYYDICGNSGVVFAPVYSSDEYCIPTLSIDNDNDIPEFYEHFKIKYEEAKKNPYVLCAGPYQNVEDSEDIQYAVVEYNWVKRSWWNLTIFGDFDLQKISVSVSRSYIFESDEHFFETFDIYYDNQDFEFREHFGSNWQESFLINSNGEREDFDIYDDEADAGHEEDDD